MKGNRRYFKIFCLLFQRRNNLLILQWKWSEYFKGYVQCVNILFQMLPVLSLPSSKQLLQPSVVHPPSKTTRGKPVLKPIHTVCCIRHHVYYQDCLLLHQSCELLIHLLYVSQYLFKKILFIYFNWRLIMLQYHGGFCNTLTLISHGCTCVPHPELPSHLPPHPIPLGYPSAPTLSALFHALNLDWSSISHMAIYMFQCYSLKSFHPHLLPWSPKVCSLYVCLFCCLAYRVIVTIFLNSIYMR